MDITLIYVLVDVQQLSITTVEQYMPTLDACKAALDTIMAIEPTDVRSVVTARCEVAVKT